MRKDIGIDLGTDNTMIYVRSKGLVLNEPSCVVVDRDSKEIIAIGNNARDMIGRTPKNILTVHPIRDGVIADFDAAHEMIAYFIKKSLSKKGFVKPRVVICIPTGVSQVEKKAVEEAILQAGAREVIMVDEPMAAAIGVGLPVEEPVASMIVDIGAGMTESAVISMNGIVASTSVRVGGKDIDRNIIQYVKRKYSVHIGDATAEAIKLDICSLIDDGKKTMEVKGRDTITGLPKSIYVNSEEIRECIISSVDRIVNSIKDTLENTPPELSADILDKGITLTGGTSHLSGLASYISEATGMIVSVAENAQDAVVMGTGKLLEEIDFVKKDFAVK